MATKTPIERFRAKVQISDGPDDACAIWGAAKDQDGYGMFCVDKRMVRAHRWIYEFLIGPIPEGLHIDHVCRNRACVNVNHLEPVTLAENNRRKPEEVMRASLAKAIAASVAKRRALTYCKSGHLFSDENTRIRSNGNRVCRQCAREQQRARRAQQKANA